MRRRAHFLNDLLRLYFDPKVGWVFFKEIHFIQIESQLDLLMHPNNGLRINHSYKVMFPYGHIKMDR